MPLIQHLRTCANTSGELDINLLGIPMNSSRFLLACLALALSSASQAAPIFSNSGVVGSPTNVATFDSLNSDDLDLSAYTEDGIVVGVGDQSLVNFNAFNKLAHLTRFHFGRAGNESSVTISLADGGTIAALDFLLGDGFLGSTTNFYWETSRGGSTTGSGNAVLNKGSTVGWTDVDGFTSLRVAAFAIGEAAGFGEQQAIALDDVRIGAATSFVPIPEPGVLALLGLGLLGVGFARHSVSR